MNEGFFLLLGFVMGIWPMVFFLYKIEKGNGIYETKREKWTRVRK